MLLPCFNYIFCNCPVWVTISFFKEIGSCLVSFIWNRASPRMAKSMLSLPSWLGGLALPNFLVYFWAVVLVSAYQWFQSSRANAATSLEVAFLGSLLDLRNLIYRVCGHTVFFRSQDVPHGESGKLIHSILNSRPTVPCSTLMG